MHGIPPWYIALYEFGYVFHSIADLLFLALGFLIVALVSRPGWQHHLRWANPAAAASVLNIISRVILDLHHYLGIGGRWNVDLTFDLLNYSVNMLEFYSTFMLWRTLRDLARHPASTDPLAVQEPAPGVWPPPPMVR